MGHSAPTNDSYIVPGSPKTAILTALTGTSMAVRRGFAVLLAGRPQRCLNVRSLLSATRLTQSPASGKCVRAILVATVQSIGASAGYPIVARRDCAAARASALALGTRIAMERDTQGDRSGAGSDSLADPRPDLRPPLDEPHPCRALERMPTFMCVPSGQ